MNQNHNEYARIMGVSPSSKGFGFAILEGRQKLVSWDNKSAKGDRKNAQCLKHLKKLLDIYKPEVLVLEDCSAKSCLRRKRTRILIQAMADLGPAYGMSIALVSKEQVKQSLLTDGKGTQYDIAVDLAKRFPEELAHDLPPKRKIYEAENSKMDIFDAMALVLASIEAFAEPTS